MKIIRVFIILFLAILIVDYCFINSSWGFIDAVYYNIFWAFHFSSIISLIIFIILLKYKNVKIALLILFTLWVLIFFGQFHQIDSYDYPHDIKVISQSHDIKIVVTECKSQKTDDVDIDTIKVKDKFIFRKYLKKL